MKNKGAAWGIFSDGTIFLTIISIIGIIIMVTFYSISLVRLKEKPSKLLAITVGMLVGGAFGNLVDRLAFGYVRDFINFDFINFPVFNFADASLTIGIVLILIYFVFFFKFSDKKREKDDKNDINDKKDNEGGNE